jgi:hypothetical protein
MRLARWSPPGRGNHGHGQRYPLSATAGRECEESVLTGESLPAEKLPGPFRLARRWLSCCALMGTVVHAGSGTEFDQAPLAELLPARLVLLNGAVGKEQHPVGPAR